MECLEGVKWGLVTYQTHLELSMLVSSTHSVLECYLFPILLCLPLLFSSVDPLPLDTTPSSGYGLGLGLCIYSVYSDAMSDLGRLSPFLLCPTAKYFAYSFWFASIVTAFLIAFNYLVFFGWVETGLLPLSKESICMLWKPWQHDRSNTIETLKKNNANYKNEPSGTSFSL